MYIRVRNGDVNGAIRALKKKLMREGFFQELKLVNLSCRRVRRNESKSAGRRRWLKKQEKQKAERGY